MASGNLHAAQPVDDPCLRHTEIDSLLIRVGQGDRHAFAAFYDKLGQTVYAMNLRHGHSPQLSAEVTHDVFLRAWRQARTYRREAGSAWKWLHAIASEASSVAETDDPDDVRQGPACSAKDCPNPPGAGHAR